MDPVPDPDTHADTKTALLDAAERLFAAGGIAASSLRAITGEAGANLASVNYHFGSKEGLVRAVFGRRLGPLNQQRLDLLAKCTSHGERKPDLECLLRAFVQPAMIMLKSRDAGDREFAKLMGRALSEPTQELQTLIMDEFRLVGERFTEQLCALFPALPQEEIIWRFHFMVGALAHTVAAPHQLTHRLERLQLPRTDDVETLTSRLVGFLRAGWQGLGTSTRPSAREEA